MWWLCWMSDMAYQTTQLLLYPPSVLPRYGFMNNHITYLLPTGGGGRGEEKEAGVRMLQFVYWVEVYPIICAASYSSSACLPPAAVWRSSSAVRSTATVCCGPLARSTTCRKSTGELPSALTSAAAGSSRASQTTNS